MDGDSGFARQGAAAALMLRAARRRAAADIALVLLLTLAVALVGETADQQLQAGVAALSLGILAFVMRRGRDLEQLARHNRWRDEAVAGRGMPLARWQAGAALPGWDERRDSPAPERD